MQYNVDKVQEAYSSLSWKQLFQDEAHVNDATTPEKKERRNLLFFLLLSLFESLTDMLKPAECLSSTF